MDAFLAHAVHTCQRIFCAATKSTRATIKFSVKFNREWFFISSFHRSGEDYGGAEDHPLATGVVVEPFEDHPRELLHFAVIAKLEAFGQSLTSSFNIKLFVSLHHSFC